MSAIFSFIRDESGATAVEYSILAVAIAAVIVAIVYAVGVKTESAFSGLNDSWEGIE